MQAGLEIDARDLICCFAEGNLSSYHHVAIACLRKPELVAFGLNSHTLESPTGEHVASLSQGW